jgi:hypothetical protein
MNTGRTTEGTQVGNGLTPCVPFFIFAGDKPSGEAGKYKNTFPVISRPGREGKIKDHCQGKDIWLKIDSSYVGMESARTYQSTSTRKLSYWVEQETLDLGTYSQDSLETGENLTNTEESSEDNLNDIQAQMSQKSAVVQIRQLDTSDSLSALQNIRQQCILYLWSLIFGSAKADRMAERMGISRTQSVSLSYDSGSQSASSGGTVKTLSTVPVSRLKSKQESYFAEEENTSFSTTGTVKTADGREINFNLDVGMSRKFSRYTSQEYSGIAMMCDPLVINLEDNVAEVSDQKFYFDLDADGEEEAISQLCSGSGYLALDKNNDGVINDGSELFGTQSGDGFADLAAYDDDGNGWIDENDEIWDKLQIWIQDEDGESRLYRLADKGVGAICLQRAATDFTEKNSQGEVNAAIRSTGIFLYENGGVGTVQHVDLAAAKLEKLA